MWTNKERRKLRFATRSESIGYSLVGYEFVSSHTTLCHRQPSQHENRGVQIQIKFMSCPYIRTDWRLEKKTEEEKQCWGGCRERASSSSSSPACQTTWGNTQRFLLPSKSHEQRPRQQRETTAAKKLLPTNRRTCKKATSTMVKILGLAVVRSGNDIPDPIPCTMATDLSSFGFFQRPVRVLFRTCCISWSSFHPSVVPFC